MTNLKQYFPTLKTRQQIQKEIHQKPHLLNIYNTWSQEKKEQFLDYCTGIKGQKLLYDAYFKRIFDPDLHPERLISFLSLLLDALQYAEPSCLFRLR